MMGNPLVSVCCICYNQEQYIRQALDGFVMQQTNFPFEVVISDDCSKDGTRAVLAEYKEKYPELIRDVSKDFNQGVISNWWYVQSEARGKYTAICEGDDFWTDPLKLQKQVDFLESHPEYSMCFHGAEIKNESRTRELITCKEIENKEYQTNDIFPGWVIPTASVIYRREMVEKYPSLKYPEWAKYGDIVLFLKCVHVGRVWGMSEKMSVYRMTENGAVVSQRNEVDYKDRLCKHYMFLMENFPLLDKTWPKNYIATWYYTKFRDGKNLRDLWIAFRNAPLYVIKKILKIKVDGTY